MSSSFVRILTICPGNPRHVSNADQSFSACAWPIPSFKVRRMRILRLGIALSCFAGLAALGLACSSSSSSSSSGGTSADSGTTTKDSGTSTCGNPGDVGNSQGVGKYCTGFSDCSGNGKATTCSILGDQTTHFCTFLCTNPDGGADGGADSCGENATCV